MVPPGTADGRGSKPRVRIRSASAGRSRANGNVSSSSRTVKRIAQNTAGTAEISSTKNSRQPLIPKGLKTDASNGRASKRANSTLKTRQLPSSTSNTSSGTGNAPTLQLFQQRYQTLKVARERERAEAIANGILADPNKPRTLAEAITPKGTCQDMCPEFERVERVVQNDVWAAEADLQSTRSAASSRQLPIEAKMVKKFRRAAAGLDEQLPSDLRPPPVLQMTVDYLFDTVIGEADSLASVHHFVWDRTRAIRNDFSIQQITKASDLCIAINCYERIARFHIVSLHQLALPEKPYDKYDAQQEREQLDKTLLSLMQYYDDSRNIVRSENEAEFRSYCIIFQIQDPVSDLEDRVQSWPLGILHNPRVQRALALYAAASNTSDSQGPLKPRIPHLVAQANWRKFWTLVFSNEVSYLMACVAEIYFGLVRKTAIKSIWQSYRRGGNTKTTDWSLDELIPVLGFENEDEVQDFCEQYGFSVSEQPDGTAYLELESVVGRQLPEPSSPVQKQICSALVEYKRHDRTLPAVIRGITVREAAEAGMLEGTSDDEMTDGSAQPDTLFVPNNVPPTVLAEQPPTQDKPTFSLFPGLATDQKAKSGTNLALNNLERPKEPAVSMDSIPGPSKASQPVKSLPEPPLPFTWTSRDISQSQLGQNELPVPLTQESTSSNGAPSPVQLAKPYFPPPSGSSGPSGPSLFVAPDDKTSTPTSSSISPPSLLNFSSPADSRTSSWSNPSIKSPQKPLLGHSPIQSAASVSAGSAETHLSSKTFAAPNNSEEPSNLTPTLIKDPPVPQQSSALGFKLTGGTSNAIAPSVSPSSSFIFSSSNLQPAPTTHPPLSTQPAPAPSVSRPMLRSGATNEVQLDTRHDAHARDGQGEKSNPMRSTAVQLKRLEEVKAKQAVKTHARQAAGDAQSLQERKSKLINGLANIIMFERHGFLNQYIEHLAGPLVRAAQQQIEVEELRRGADAFRIKTLSQRYGERWRKIFWERQVKRRGKERRMRQSRDAKILSSYFQDRNAQTCPVSIGQSHSAGLGHDQLTSTAVPVSPDVVIGTLSSNNSSLILEASKSTQVVSDGSVKARDAQAVERRRQRLDRHTVTDTVQTPELLPSRPYTASDDPTSSSPSPAGGRFSLHQANRRDTTRSSYFKLKALGVPQQGILNLQPMQSALPDLKRQRSLTPEFDAVPHSKRKALGITQSLDLGRNRLPVFRRSNRGSPQRSLIERHESNGATSIATKEDSVLRMPKDFVEEISDEEERLFAAARSTREAMTDSIFFFREEAVKGGNVGHRSPYNSHVRGAASLDTSFTHAGPPQTYTASVTSIPNTQHPPPKYRAHVSKFLRRDEHAGIAASQSERSAQFQTSSLQHRSTHSNISSSRPTKRGRGGSDVRASTRPFTDSLFSAKRHIGIRHDAMSGGILSVVDVEDDEGYGEDVDSEDKETRKKSRAVDGSAIDRSSFKPRLSIENDNNTEPPGASRSDHYGSGSVTSLEGDENRYENDVNAGTEDDEEVSEQDEEEAEEEVHEAREYKDSWASKGGTSFDDAIEL